MRTGATQSGLLCVLKRRAHLAQDGEVVTRDVHDLAVVAHVVPHSAVREDCRRWAADGGSASSGEWAPPNSGEERAPKCHPTAHQRRGGR